jgi:hypothetical protein
MSNEVELARGSLHPLAILQSAIEKGTDPEKLGKLMDLVERFEANQAAARFAEAMAQFQADCPLVPKLRTVKKRDGGEMYHYANYEDVYSVARPHLKSAGIAVSFSTPAGENGLWRMVCHVSVGSRTVDYQFSGPEMTAADLTAYAKSKPGGMNVEQARGEQLSYRKRYCLCAALGIVVSDEDNDMAAPNLAITEEEQAKLAKLIEANGIDLERFLAWVRQSTGAEVDCLAEVPAHFMAKALAAIRPKNAEVKEAEAAVRQALREAKGGGT